MFLKKTLVLFAATLISLSVYNHAALAGDGFIGDGEAIEEVFAAGETCLGDDIDEYRIDACSEERLKTLSCVSLEGADKSLLCESPGAMSAICAINRAKSQACDNQNSFGQNCATLGFGSPTVVCDHVCDIPRQTDPGQTVYWGNRSFGQTDNDQQRADVAWPKQPGTYPGIVLIHGGGWMAGDKDQFTPYIRALAEQGFVVASINYRLAPDHIFPAQIADVRCALRWLRTRPLLPLDPDKILLIGTSAGGHLAALAATAWDDESFDDGACFDSGWKPENRTSSDITAAISVYGPTDLRVDPEGGYEPGKAPAKEALFGVEDLRTIPEVLAAASPVVRIDSNDRPLLFIHGVEDKKVPVWRSRLLYKQAVLLGVPTSIIEIQGAYHGFFRFTEDTGAPDFPFAPANVGAMFDREAFAARLTTCVLRAYANQIFAQ